MKQQKQLSLDYQIENLFPTPIQYFKINNFDVIKDDIIDYAYDLRNKEKDGRVASNRGGYQSNAFNLKGGDVFQDFLLSVVKNIPSLKNDVDVTCHAWVNINPPLSFNMKHCHPTCDVAGVMWIKIPKNSGDIVFTSPYNWMCYNELISYNDDFKKNTNYYHTYSYPAREGVIILFPAHLEHKVEENNSGEDRISASFNLNFNSISN
tara:strand:- start:87 stop:707 length:621 start_codon:yes stop_codon:yes gene_type:complete